MHVGRLVFAQVMDLLPLTEFRRCAARYPERRPGRTFSCLDQFLCMAFAQLTTRESLRDIESCLRAVPTKLYHLETRKDTRFLLTSFPSLPCFARDPSPL